MVENNPNPETSGQAVIPDVESETEPLTKLQSKGQSPGSLPKLLLIFLVLGILSAAVIIVIAIIMNFQSKDRDVTPETDSDNNVIIPVDYYRFAPYNLRPIDVTPSVETYIINPDLSNVFYLEEDDPDGWYDAVLKKELSSAMKTALAQDQFIITEAKNKEFFPVYEQNRYSFVPNFITVDSVMHTYHLMFDSMLKELETSYLSDTTKSLVKGMVAASTQQYDQYSSDVELANALKRNVAFFAVAAKLIDDGYIVPDLVNEEVTAELALINAHDNNFAISPVMSIGFDDPNLLDNLKEDYTQYIPRGHYTKSPQLEKYFRTMMWLGRMTFLSKDKSTVLSAILITDILKNDTELYDTWESIYAPINFFVGKADDITYYEYKVIYEEVFPSGFVNDPELIANFWDMVKRLDPPEINSIPIFDANIQPDRDEVITGFRFFGQRFTVDAMIFQNLIYRDIEEKEDGKRKMLPSIIEVPAAMGDQVAIDIIQNDTDFFTYPNYSSQMTKLQNGIATLTEDKWTQNLYWSWMYTLNGMVGDTPAGYPQFMLTNKWQRKELNTFVASLTELKHDTILYSKQVMAEMGDMGNDNPPDDKGYVEPNLEVYRRLLALVQMTSSGLADRDLITQTSEQYCKSLPDIKEKHYCNLKHLEDVVTQLLDITIKELTEESLTAEEYEFIRFFGGDLETMFLNTLEPDASKYTAVDDNPAMLIADVASSPNEVLEEGTGYINYIYVIVPVEGELRIAKGAVYSQYEFPVSPSERMTNEQWRSMLESGDQPEMLKWQKDLITK